MGEVWRASDTKLGRDVAIKVLPPAFTQDAERLARFEREAHLLAQLNHSTIAHIDGLEASADSTAEGVVAVDTETGSTHVIAPAGPGDRLAVSRDGRTLVVEHDALDADVWLLDLE
jgi:serine/threonine protein kinase